MTKNKSIKICRICGECESNTVTFEKHRRICRNKYFKNRHKDLKDGKRDSLNWYKSHEKLTNARIIKELNERHQRKTGVSLLSDRELRNTNYDSAQESRYVFYTFFVAWAVIVYVVVMAVVNHTGGVS